VPIDSSGPDEDRLMTSINGIPPLCGNNVKEEFNDEAEEVDVCSFEEYPLTELNQSLFRDCLVQAISELHDSHDGLGGLFSQLDEPNETAVESPTRATPIIGRLNSPSAAPTLDVRASVSSQMHVSHCQLSSLTRGRPLDKLWISSQSRSFGVSPIPRPSQEVGPVKRSFIRCRRTKPSRRGGLDPSSLCRSERNNDLPFDDSIPMHPVDGEGTPLPLDDLDISQLVVDMGISAARSNSGIGTPVPQEFNFYKI